MFKHCLVSVFLASVSTYSVQAQSFLGEGFSSAIEAVQEGIDLIWPDQLNVKGVSARLGFGLGVTPEYEGSDDYRFRIIPLIDIRYKSRLRLNGSHLSYIAYRDGPFSAGPLLHLRFGRNESRNTILAGIGDVSDTLQVGAFARYQTESALVSAEYRQALGANLGGSLLVTAGHGIYKNGKFTAMLAVRARWLSGKSMQTIYGLTESQSASSQFGLPSHMSGAGFSEVNGNLVGSYEMTEKIRLLSLVSLGSIVGDAANSPFISGHGSKTQFLTGVGVAVAF